MSPSMTHHSLEVLAEFLAQECVFGTERRSDAQIRSWEWAVQSSPCRDWGAGVCVCVCVCVLHTLTHLLPHIAIVIPDTSAPAHRAHPSLSSDPSRSLIPAASTGPLGCSVRKQLSPCVRALTAGALGAQVWPVTLPDCPSAATSRSHTGPSLSSSPTSLCYTYWHYDWSGKKRCSEPFHSFTHSF
jgi:hypothetical protein